MLSLLSEPRPFIRDGSARARVELDYAGLGSNQNSGFRAELVGFVLIGHIQ